RRPGGTPTVARATRGRAFMRRPRGGGRNRSPSRTGRGGRPADSLDSGQGGASCPAYRSKNEPARQRPVSLDPVPDRAPPPVPPRERTPSDVRVKVGGPGAGDLLDLRGNVPKPDPRRDVERQVLGVGLHSATRGAWDLLPRWIGRQRLP